MEYVYDAEVIRIVDGDTVILRLSREYDFGFYIKETKSYEGWFRLIGIDAPELRGRGAQPAKGRAATAYLTELLFDAKKITAKTYKPDSFGRWLAELFIETYDGDWVSVNEMMILEGHAVPYER